MPKSKKTKEDELNPRWAKFTELYIENGNAYQSAIQAGFSEEYSKVITTRFPTKVRNSLRDALEAKGINSDKIAQKIDLLLEAHTPIYKNNNESGEIEYVADKPDYQAIDKGISHAIKIRGDYAPEKLQHSGEIKTDSISAEVLALAEEELKKRKVK